MKKQLEKTVAFALIVSMLSIGEARSEEASGDALESYLSNLFDFYNERTELDLPSLSSDQILKLSRRESVHLVQRDPRPGAMEEGETVDRVIGMRLLDHPREAVWLAALDPDVPIGDYFHDFRLEYDGAGSSSWWVFLDLPWPIADRQWVADLWKNRELAEAAQGYLWEHRWDLRQGGEEIAKRLVAEGRLEGIERVDVESSVYLPVNRGALIAAQYGEDKTLLIYNLSTVVGGFIPDRVVSAFSKKQVGSFLDLVDERSAGIYAHYGPDHERLFDGLGRVIPSRGSASAYHDKAADNP